MDLKALLAKLKAEGISEEDAIKLIQEEFDAGNRGLVQKRDELLASEVELKKKIADMETKATEALKVKNGLEEQLKKSNPEEHKKYYEGLAKELETKHVAELATVVSERDKYKSGHEARIRDDAIAEATKDLKFIDGLRDGFIALALSKNQFTAKEIDGKTIFTNQSDKTIQAVLHEFSLSNEGKAFIKNGNSGSGAAGSNNQTGQGGAAKGGKSMNRVDFDGLDDSQKHEFMTSGGILTD